MGDQRDTSASTFMSATALSQMGMSSVPECYILPQSKRPNQDQGPHCPIKPLPLIDLSSLENPFRRSQVIEELHEACKELGSFQVINHGIPVSVINEALEVAEEFFDMPNERKMPLASTDASKPVRYGTSLNVVNDKVKYWRDFIKHYSNPISTWIEFWPSDPPSYKKKMGNYAEAAHVLQKRLMEVLFESLGLKPDYLHKDIGEGSQVMAVNCYPSCPEPNLTLGLPPHSDYGFLTILLQSQRGLEIIDTDGKWKSVPLVKGGLVVQLGDHMEVLSNGRYKGVIHRAILNSENKRLSIASLHSLEIDKKVIPAPELVDEQHPPSYKEVSFRDFLNFISENDILEARYIDTLRKNPQIGLAKQTEDA